MQMKEWSLAIAVVFGMLAMALYAGASMARANFDEPTLITNSSQPVIEVAADTSQQSSNF